MLKKKSQLGEHPSTASAKLKKSILFHYVKKCGHNCCFQCGAEIISVDELSIEHKIPWLDSENPVKLFYDLDNISFSHLTCNIRNARKYNKGLLVSEHGTISRYTNNNCRCKYCKEAMKLWKRNRRS